ncbi:MAG: class I SAM-dependent methyltransferase [Bacteroidetes bacterium]|nr:class I SAM-dependent methyltransferase [Bacteroidota bacterium]
MKYDLLKDRISVWLDKYPKLLPILYGLMDKLFLRTWYVHRSLRRINPQFGSKLLDAGTGFGQYAWHTLHKYPGVHVTATDLKKDYLDRGARSFDAFGLSDRVTWKVDDLTAPNLKELFDYILAVDVLEHIVEDEMAIAHFAKLLNRGGYLIISTPSDQGGSDVHDSTQESFIGEHVRDGYNLEDLINKLSNAGFQTVEQHYSYGTWGSVAWRLLIKLPILLLGKSILFTPLVMLYYLPVLPLGLLLNFVDLKISNKVGTGLIVVACRET